MTSSAPRPPVTVTPDQLTALRERALALMEEHHVPGVALGLLTPGGQHEVCLGVTSVETGLPVTPDTLGQIGSITKTFVAVALARLAGRGDLDLDGRVRTYLPDFRLVDGDVAARVTVRQLLNHTAGWAGDHFENTGDGDDALARIVESVSRLPQVTPLGEVWSYNNAAFHVAGRVLEVVTGRRFEDALRDLVLTPLGLTNSFFFPDEVMTRRFNVGHVVRNGRPVVARPWALGRSANAAGGLACSLRDLLTYARFQLGDGTAESGERVLSTEGLRALHEPAVDADSGRRMGVSWFVSDEGGVRTISHGGATNGQMATLRVIPELGFAFAALTNCDRGEAVYAALGKWVREEVLGLRVPAPTYLDVDRATLDELAGWWVMAGAGDRIEVSVDGSDLLLRFVEGDYSAIADVVGDPLPPQRARFEAPDRLVLTEGPLAGTRADVLRFPDGRVRFLRTSRVYTPVSGETR
ncbi:serine hydrolase domain-containing protein [Deinococcus pimensis]|uniref:serine hydrolase domain-containing protein n=1 Tax=Deinococcus pimensis TaxID=309888 RepID=UPI000481BB1B|nr:serine hydrolase domain-containing protein [Deinococcus pimensis]